MDGQSDKRLGTYFPQTGAPLRVNGTITDRTLAFNYDASLPNLPYGERGRGLQFSGATLNAAHTRMSGRVRLADGRDVSFTAVKDNIAPEFSLSVPVLWPTGT